MLFLQKSNYYYIIFIILVKTTTLIMPVVFLYFKPRTVTAIGTHQPKAVPPNERCCSVPGAVKKS